MVLPLYLAMTAAEIQNHTRLPSNLAYMACHFSPYGTGLSNFPKNLPEGALLILNDRTPICGHDPVRITQELCGIAEEFSCRGILLDFQRPDAKEIPAVVRQICLDAPCPVGVSHLYTPDMDCAVFLPPIPPDTLPGDYLAPWVSRELWLDISAEGEILTLTENGAQTAPLPSDSCPNDGFPASDLHCHYRIEADQEARFTLFRTRDDLLELITAVQRLGVTLCAGLYQELKNYSL